MPRLHAGLWVVVVCLVVSRDGVPSAQSGNSVGPVYVHDTGRLEGDPIDSSRASVEANAAPSPGLQRYEFFPHAGNPFEDIGIVNFVDLDPSGAIADYRCGDYTYNGHRGHDSAILSFKQQDIGVPIFAALDGTVVVAHDGEFDQQTSGASAQANYVELDHGGGHRTLYLHMKKGSVTVAAGQRVVAGAQLGLTGSSGSSTAPHLHFESRLNGVAFEPHAGNCASGSSMWTRQVDPPAKPTLDEVIFSLARYDVNQNGYPFDNAVRVRGFTAGQLTTFYPRIKFSHAPPNSSYQFQFLRPNNSVLFGFAGSFGNSTSVRGGWWWFPASLNFDTAGTWKFRIIVNGTLAGDVPFAVVAPGTTIPNHAPNPIAVVLDPAVPQLGDVPFCRVQSSPVYLRDPDYDIVRYRYRWIVNGSVVREVTTAGMADAIPHSLLATGARITCAVTPMDALTSGNTAEISTVVGQALPAMALDKPSLVIGALTTGTGFAAKTSPQTVRLTQSGAGAVTWTATSAAPWLLVSPGSGSGSGTLTVAAQFVAGLIGSQTGSVNLTFTGAANASATIAVTLNVADSRNAAAPTGSLDTPVDGATGVAGSIAVTGWALDDVEVTGVRIMRDPVAGEPAGELVLIGNATLVDGARTDVAALYPARPRNTRAGWGYLMLTNFLPGLGNGTFRLTAIADDADGHSTVIGTRTITCANSTATGPFGAIDTPDPGAVVSGTISNFGWVLSRDPRRADPPGAGTVRVAIDGVVIGPVPGGWTSRTDLSARFPVTEYAGITTALGVLPLDTTTLTNGVHTVAWIVTDNAGTGAGIGSRYFTVSNGADLPLSPSSVSALRVTAGDEPIAGRRGFDLEAPFAPLERDATGMLTLAAEELDRIELHVRARRAHVRSPAGDLPLPIGSRLDAAAATFTWQAGPGFLGVYDLVFETSRGEQVVRVTLYPQGMLTRPQVIIDSPAAGAELTGAFTVAGWAVHPEARTGTGIDAVHVWAYPAGGELPIFLGAATPAGERPDVAAIYGPRARHSGYGIAVGALPPGKYTLAVFGWSAGEREFLPASTKAIVVR